MPSTKSVADRLSAPPPRWRRCCGCRSFRRLWIALGLSSLGDWLGLLALTALASALAGDGYAAQNFAIAGVLFLRVLPALVLGPLAGYVADRLDRRWTLSSATCCGPCSSLDPVRRRSRSAWLGPRRDGVLEAISLVWMPAKDATIPNLVPREPARGSQPALAGHDVRLGAAGGRRSSRCSRLATQDSASLVRPIARRPGRRRAVLQRAELLRLRPGDRHAAPTSRAGRRSPRPTGQLLARPSSRAGRTSAAPS